MNRITPVILCAAVVSTSFSAGCSSISSTYIGTPAPGTRYQGIPILVDRPRYLQVTYRQVTYRAFTHSISVDSDGNTQHLVAPVDRTAAAEGQDRHEWIVDEVEVGVLSIPELFTLDLKRPAAGTNEYALEFEQGARYPTKLGATITDKTIEAVGSAVGETLKKVTEAFTAASKLVDRTEMPVNAIRIAERVAKIELRRLDDLTIVYTIEP